MDGTLRSRGGVATHTSASHGDTGVAAGDYGSFATQSVNSAGHVTKASNVWVSTYTYPANHVVLGSNSKLYKAVISNIGNDPTTDNGTNWVRVALVPIGASTGQLLKWNNTTLEPEWGTADAGGTVTSFSAGDLSPLFTTTETNPTTTPALTFAQVTQAANLVFAGPTSGGAANPTFRALVAADISGLAGTVASGTVNHNTLRWNGTAWVESAVISNNAAGVTITPTATNKVTITGTTGASTIPALDITNDATALLWLSSSVALGAASGAELRLMTTLDPDATNRRLGVINFGMNNAGSAVTGAGIRASSAEDWTLASAQGTSLFFYTTAVGAASVISRLILHADGDIQLNGSNSALATSATKGFTHLPNCAGVPTGTPGNTITGATPIVVDTTHNTLLIYNSGWFPVNHRVPVTLTDGANIATDASLGKEFRVTLGGNRTMDNPTNAVNGQMILYRIKQDGTGSRTITWGSNFRFSSDVPSPTLTTTAAKVDYVLFIYNATDTKWDCLAVTKGF